MEWLNSLVAGLTGGIGACAVGLFGARYMLGKMVDQHFARLQSQMDEKTAMQAAAARGQLEHELAIYPAVSELVYRAKTAADMIRTARTPVQLLNPELITACRTLTSQLLSYRIHVPCEIFDDLHEYKHALQDLLVMGDFLTRPVADAATRELQRDELARINELCDTVARLCGSIIERLQGRIHALQGPLALPV